MLTMSHIAMAKNTLRFLKFQGLEILDDNSFIYGNIKPDNLFQKTPRKHLEKESLAFILEEIEMLRNSDMGKDKKTSSLKLGVVCHYLCDYFCLPHFERWSACPIYKKALETPRHLNYERMLCSYIDKATMEYKEINDVVEFLEGCKKEYILDKSFKNDIRFASLVCNSISLYILKNRNNYDKIKK